MKRTCKTLLILAILTASLTLTGCATKGKSVVLLDGRHVKSWSKADAAKVEALSQQAAMADSWVYVCTDEGLKIMYGIDVTAHEEKK